MTDDRTAVQIEFDGITHGWAFSNHVRLRGMLARLEPLLSKLEPGDQRHDRYRMIDGAADGIPL